VVRPKFSAEPELFDPPLAVLLSTATNPGGDGRLSPPDSPARVGPHKGWAAGSGGPASPDLGLAVQAQLNLCCRRRPVYRSTHILSTGLQSHRGSYLLGFTDLVEY
jgi:hypothetical protein